MKLKIDIPDVMYSDIQKGIIRKHIDKVFVAIENGTPVSNEGDLISRSELKKAIEELAITEELVDYDCDDVSTTGVSQYLDRPDVLDLIDNAPTVDKGYDFGYADGHGEGYELGKNSRPQGEWIIDGHHIRCNRCNEYICNTDREGNKIPDNFCPNCGADMRGDKE